MYRDIVVGSWAIRFDYLTKIFKCLLEIFVPNGFYIKAEQLKYELSDKAGEERADECADTQHSTHAPAGESDGCLDDSLCDGN